MSTLVRDRAPAPGRLRRFDFPDVALERLGNGMRVLHARQGDLPLVTLALVLEAGATEEPAEQAGLAYLTANALSAGTRRRDADEIAWAIESLGVDLETHATWDAGLVRMTVPRERLDDAATLFAEVVREPAFPEREIGRLREQQLAALLQRRKQPGALASDAAMRTIFSGATPFSRPLPGRTDAVERLTPEDVGAFYRERYAPSSAALLVVGAIDRAEALALAERHFGDWPGESAPRRDYLVEPALETTSVVVVDRPSAVQSEIRIGDVGVARDTPDFFPLLVMNTVLGGSFMSRLNMNLREKHGFTYGARSGFSMRRRPGPFLVQTAVANDVTGRAVEEALSEISRLREHGATEEELSSARDYQGGVMPLQLQTTSQLAGSLEELVVHGLPLDYFQHYRDRVAAVTGDDVLRVAREYLRPDRFGIVVAGAAPEVAPQLEQLGVGPVRVVDGGA